MLQVVSKLPRITHRNNCKCCPVSLLIVGSQILPSIKESKGYTVNMNCIIYIQQQQELIIAETLKVCIRHVFITNRNSWFQFWNVQRILYCFCEGFGGYKEVSRVDRDWVRLGKLIFSLFLEFSRCFAFSSHHPLSSEFKFVKVLMIKVWFTSFLAFLSLTSLSSWVFIKSHGLLVPHSSIHWYLAFFFLLHVWKTISSSSFLVSSLSSLLSSHKHCLFF